MFAGLKKIKILLAFLCLVLIFVSVSVYLLFRGVKLEFPAQLDYDRSLYEDCLTDQNKKAELGSIGGLTIFFKQDVLIDDANAFLSSLNLSKIKSESAIYIFNSLKFYEVRNVIFGDEIEFVCKLNATRSFVLDHADVNIWTTGAGL